LAVFIEQGVRTTSDFGQNFRDHLRWSTDHLLQNDFSHPEVKKEEGEGVRERERERP